MKIEQSIYLVCILLGTLACTNNDVEDRLSKLEGKVAALEGTSRYSSSSKIIPATDKNSPNAATASTEKPSGPLPSFQFDEETYDFGTIKEGDIVTHTFKFTNNGERPLVISNARATCGCTVTDWPKEPIAIGETGEINVKFNSTNKLGVQNKTVTLTANTWPRSKQIKVRANVVKKEG